MAERSAQLQKHIVLCPHCGKEVLDHMTACPFCQGELTPRGYCPPDPAKMKKIRTALMVAGIVIAAALVIWLLFLR